ncbi:hypothetical protein K456DRAFT_156882 [Colletotrichum gloeosporioides 23]|nr:hypothetical protein K456DRAFT_156882 [Colletotrichum gloeosporioides 23]
MSISLISNPKMRLSEPSRISRLPACPPPPLHRPAPHLILELIPTAHPPLPRKHDPFPSIVQGVTVCPPLSKIFFLLKRQKKTGFICSP